MHHVAHANLESIYAMLVFILAFTIAHYVKGKSDNWLASYMAGALIAIAIGMFFYFSVQKG
jgi:high-affinity Fe2+/Pb2+ permease